MFGRRLAQLWLCARVPARRELLRSPSALLRCLLRRPPFLECSNDRSPTSRTELAFRFLGCRLCDTLPFGRGPSQPLCCGDCFAPRSAHFSSWTSRRRCSLVATVSHGAEFRELCIEPAFLF